MESSRARLVVLRGAQRRANHCGGNKQPTIDDDALMCYATPNGVRRKSMGVTGPNGALGSRGREVLQYGAVGVVVCSSLLSSNKWIFQ
jgi:hypothetical protein